MHKKVMMMATIVMLGGLILTSCGGGGGSDDPIDNSHMFGAFQGALTWYYLSNSPDVQYDGVEFEIGNDMGRIEEMYYVYMPTDSTFFEYSEVYENGIYDDITFYYTATATDNSITFERSYTQSGDTYNRDQGAITFNNDFDSGEASGKILNVSEPAEIIFQITNITRQ